MVEKEFSDVSNPGCSKILLYSLYFFSAPLGSKSTLLKQLGHELLLSLLGQSQLQGSSSQLRVDRGIFQESGAHGEKLVCDINGLKR